MTDKVSLDIYAKAHKQQCWICTLPERQEIDAGLMSGITPGLISRWLRDVCGHEDATADKVRSHLRRRHHERA